MPCESIEYKLCICLGRPIQQLADQFTVENQAASVAASQATSVAVSHAPAHGEQIVLLSLKIM